MVADTMLGVMAQRLVRRLCEECKVSYRPTDAELADLGISRDTIPGEVFRAVGCEACNQHGYKSRVGIFEFLPATLAVKEAVLSHADTATIKRAAIAAGMKTLRDDGIRVVRNGITTFDEVIRVTREDADE